jgi:hypothetical protein
MVNPERRRAPALELHFNTALTAVATSGVLAISTVLWQTYNEVRTVRDTFPLTFTLKSEMADLRLEIEHLRSEVEQLKKEVRK